MTGFNLALYLKRLLMFSGILFLIYGAISLLLPENYTSKAFWGFIPFYYVVASVSKWLMHKFSGDDSRKFSFIYVQVTVFRFLLYIGILLLYAFNFPDDAKAFIITFFVFYFAYTLFEVSSLYKKG